MKTTGLPQKPKQVGIEHTFAKALRLLNSPPSFFAYNSQFEAMRKSLDSSIVFQEFSDRFNVDSIATMLLMAIDADARQVSKSLLHQKGKLHAA